MKLTNYIPALLSFLIVYSLLSCDSSEEAVDDGVISGTSNMNKKGPGRLIFQQNNLSMNIWYYAPKDNPKDAPILFVLHGVERNAQEYRDIWISHAQQYGLLVIAPEFSEANFPGSDGYNLGNMFTTSNAPHPEKDWSFSMIEPIFNFVLTKIEGVQPDYNIYGHSAGSQFVTRLLTFKNGLRVKRAIAANAGWYTLLDLNEAFPYGLKNTVANDENMNTMLEKKLVILLGELDTNTNDPNLNNSPEALLQGAHRLARGNNFFETSLQLAANRQVPFNWMLKTVPGVGHSNTQMAPTAAQELYED